MTMTELITKMVLCLVAALILGMIIGWLLSKMSGSKKHIIELDDKDESLVNLQQEYETERSISAKLNNSNRELKGLLLQKTNLLEEKSIHLLDLQKDLNLAKNNVNEHVNAKDQNTSLLKQVTQLENAMKAKNNEVLELESVLIKAEQTIEEKQDLLDNKSKEIASFVGQGSSSEVATENSDALTRLEERVATLNIVNEEKNHSIALYQDTIKQLEKELKLYTVNKEDDEFVISKDQFTHIEEQLVEYQKEIHVLKENNKKLLGNKKENEDIEIEKDSVDGDDGSIVKLFRDTYKKITKP